MKRLLGGAMLLSAGMFSVSAYANPTDSCDGEQTIFDAYAIKGGKHVGVCYVAGNVRYVYGKDSGKPDILLNVPADKVKFTLSGNGDQSVTIPNGDYSYTVGESLRGGSSIQVWKQQKLITEIELSGETLENHIEKFSNTANFATSKHSAGKKSKTKQHHCNRKQSFSIGLGCFGQWTFFMCTHF